MNKRVKIKHFSRFLLTLAIVLTIVLTQVIKETNRSYQAVGNQFTLGAIPQPRTEDFTGTVVHVSTDVQLRAALLDRFVTQIFLENDIVLTGTLLNDVSVAGIGRNLMINGQNHVLTIRQSTGNNTIAFRLLTTNVARVILFKDIKVAGGRTLGTNNVFRLIDPVHQGNSLWEQIFDNFEYLESPSPFTNLGGTVSTFANGFSSNLFFRNQVKIAPVQTVTFLRPGNVIFDVGSNVTIKSPLNLNNNVFQQTHSITIAAFVAPNAIVSIDGGSSANSIFTIFSSINVYPDAQLTLSKASSANGVVWSTSTNFPLDINVDSGGKLVVQNGDGPVLRDQGFRTRILSNPGAIVELVGNNSTNIVNFTNTASRIILDDPLSYNIQNTNVSGSALTSTSTSVSHFQLLNTNIAVWQRGTSHEERPTAPSPFGDVSLFTGNTGLLGTSTPVLGTMPGGWVTNNYSRLANAFRVVFELNGGVSSADLEQYFVLNDLLIDPGNPSKEGHAFNGWNTMQDGSGHTWDFETDRMPASDMTLYAQWSANQYNLHFNINGGVGENPASQLVAFNELSIAVSNPIRTGFTFDKWTTEQDGSGTVWDFGTTLMPANDVMLYAQWTRNNYDLIFDVNGGDTLAPVTQNIPFEGLASPVAEPTRLGHVFLGWNTSPTGDGVSWNFETTLMPAVNTTLYARWELDTFNLHFNLNGGSGVPPVSQEVVFGDLAQPVSDPIREGFTFEGWNTQANGLGLDWDFASTTVPANDTTLYAQWTRNYYDLSFDGNGGDTLAPTTQNIPFEGLASPVTNPSKEGHRFVGWNTMVDGSGVTWEFGTTLMPATNTTLYAQWEVNYYNVHFHLNGGEGTPPASRTVPFNQLISAEAEPVRNGFAFAEWNMMQDGSGVAWNFNSTLMPANDVTLYAQWSVNSFVASFDLNGGDSAVPNNQLVEFGGFIIDPGMPSKVGHAFVEWNTQMDGLGDAWNFNVQEMPANNITLYAQWSVQSYLLDFDLNGGIGDIPGQQSVVFNTLAYPVDNPIKEGFTFDGWNTMQNGTGIDWDFSTTLMPANNVMLYAQWNINSFVATFDLNGGDSTVPVSQEVPFGDVIVNPGNPTKVGHAFNGWNTMQDGTGQTWDFDTTLMPASDITLYAQWIANQYNLHFNVNGGLGENPTSQIVTFNELSIAVSNPIRTGFTFDKWTTEQDGSGIVWDFGTTLMPANDVMLYAQWTRNNYDLIFDVNGGDTLVPVTQNIPFEGLASPVAEPTRLGHVFLGWNTSPTGDGVSWNFETTLMPAVNTTLYARWELDTFNLHFNLNGGSGVPPVSQEVVFGDLAQPVSDPIREGFTLEGWNTQADGLGLDWDFASTTKPANDTTLYAQWTRNYYDLSFDVNGGDTLAPTTQNIPFEGLASPVTNPSKEGHRFVGWNTMVDGSGVTWEFGTTLMPATNTTLYAQWEVNYYNVHFHLNGGIGTAPESQVVAFNELVSSVAEPTREGFTFTEWNTMQDGMGVDWLFNSTQMPANDVTLYAQWSVDSFSVAFDLNGGDSTRPNSQLVEFDELIINPGNPSRIGHTFQGWNTMQDGSGVQWEFNYNRMPANNITLYAQWEANYYQVTFNLNGAVGDIPAEEMVLFNSLVTQVEEPTKEGHTFNGWNTMQDGTGLQWDFDTTLMPANDVILYAQWSANHYDLHFNLNGGQGQHPDSQLVEFNQLASPVTNPTKEGHRFVEWNTMQDGSGLQWNFDTTLMPATDVTLYAQWEVNEYIANFDLNGGDSEQPASQPIEFNQLISDPGNPSKEGHVFIGWNTIQNGTGVTWSFASSLMPANDVTLYAQWRVGSFNAHFNINGGSGLAPDSQSVPFGDFIQRVEDPVREGHTFIEWNTEVNGQGVVWDFDTMTKPAQETILYAQWEVNQYQLSFNLNGGQGANPESQNVEFNTVAYPVENPEKEGFTFVGWNTDQSGSGITWNFNTTLMPANNVTLYAQWDINTYVVVFNLNGGNSSQPEPQPIVFDELIINPGNPSKVGHAFNGWNTMQDGTGQTWNFETDRMPARDITLYAQWSVNRYNLHFNVNGGLGENPTSQLVAFNELSIAVTDPIRTGFTFDKWTTEQDGSGIVWDFETTPMPANDVMLYAQWTRNNYDLSFNVNGGDTLAPVTQNIPFEGLATEVADPTRVGHVFLGWNTSPTGDGVSWNFETTLMPSGNTTLYARWELDTFNLHFNLNGGSGVPPVSQEVVFGDLATPVAEPIREGFTFEGWNTQANGLGMDWDFASTTKPANDTILYAQWTRNNYDLSFEVNGGDTLAPTTQSIPFEGQASPVANPSKEGHTFVGWNTMADGSGVTWDFATTLMPAANTTLYAQWEVNFYNVHFHLNGGIGVAPESQVIAFNELVSSVAEPTREGFTFTGWNTQVDGSGEDWLFSSTQMPANDVTLYAQWSVDSFSVAFDLNGGDSSRPNNQLVPFDELVVDPGNPSRIGHTFVGWNTMQDGSGVQWVFNDNRMPANNITLYAQWEVNYYPIDFYSNDGTNEFIVRHYVPFNALVNAISNPVREGHTFVEWNTMQDGNGLQWNFETSRMPATRVVLYGQWQVNTYTVTLEVNGGSFVVASNLSLIEIRVNFGELIEEPAVPIKTGHTFVGWNTSQDGNGTTWDFTSMTMPAGDFTLYAQWQTNAYEVTFNLNGSTGEIPSQIVTFNTFISQPTNPTREGYYFVGWNTKPDGTGKKWQFEQMSMPAQNLVLYASWEVKKLPDTGQTHELTLSGILMIMFGYILLRKKNQKDTQECK